MIDLQLTGLLLELHNKILISDEKIPARRLSQCRSPIVAQGNT